MLWFKEFALNFCLCIILLVALHFFCMYSTADYFSVFISFITKQKSSEMGAVCHIPFREPLF